MKKKPQYIFIAVLALLGLSLITIPNGMRFTGFVFLGAAALWAAGLLLYRWRKKSRGALWLYRLFLAGTALMLTLLLSIEGVVVFRGEADNSAVPVDAVIVLGAGVNGETPSAALWSRIAAAADYLEQHPDVPVVLSGGQGPGEYISEAEAMRRALWTNSESWNERYLLEDRSTSTAENFKYSKELLEEYGLDTDTAVIAVVTNDFHCFRTHLIAQRQGLHIVDVQA